MISKKKVLWILCLFLWAGSLGYSSDNPVPQENQKMKKNSVFSSDNPAFDFVFDYPAIGWPVDVSEGLGYHVVYLKGPVDKEKSFTTLIEIVVKPRKDGKTAADLIQALLGRVRSWPKFKLMNQKEVRVGGRQASSLIFESEERLPMESSQAKPVAVGEQTIFFTSSDKVYRLSFHVLADRREAYVPVFEGVLKSFKFKE